MNIVAGVNFYIQTCISCGIHFGMPSETDNRFRKSYATFYCPNGHPQCYRRGTSEEDVLRQALNNQKQQNARLADEAADAERRRQLEVERHLHTQRRLRGTKAAKTLLKRRIAGGKCPCCSEHFPNLEMHMKKQHPDGKVVPMTRRAS